MNHPAKKALPGFTTHPWKVEGRRTMLHPWMTITVVEKLDDACAIAETARGSRNLRLCGTRVRVNG